MATTVQTPTGDQSKSDLLQAYAKAKGVDTLEEGVAALHKQLLHEYGFIAPVLKGLESYEIKTISFKNLHLHDVYLEHVDARPLLSQPLPLIGIVIVHGRGYRLIDGYHRLKYCLEEDLREGSFILLKEA